MKKLMTFILSIFPAIASGIGYYLLNTYHYLSPKLTTSIIYGIIALSIISLILGLVSIIVNKKNLIIASVVFSLLATTGISYADYVYNNLDDKVNIITDQTEYQYSYVYVLDTFEGSNLEALDHGVIGLKPVGNALGHDIPVEYFKEHFTIQEEIYANGPLLAGALLNQEVDAVVVDGTDLNKINELYNEFASKTKCIGEFKKELTENNGADSVDTATEPFTVLINGVDTRLGDLSMGSRADVIMLATFNPNTMKLSLISIPRDSYIPVTCEGGVRDKITHSGNSGVNCTLESLENYFDIEINYYVKLNFQALVGLVDAVGGIDVNVPISFSEMDSNDVPDAIVLEEGFQHLNGQQALALSRHRKTLIQGDIGRGLNQQIVINGLIDKLASGKIVTSVNELLEVVGDHVQTNMPKSDMMKLFTILTSLGSNSMYSNTSSLQVTSSTIAGCDAYIYEDWAGAEIYYYVPYKEAVAKVKKEIGCVLGTENYDFPIDFAYNGNVVFDPYDLSSATQLSGYTPDYD